jgi:hypothetical protein
MYALKIHNVVFWQYTTGNHEKLSQQGMVLYQTVSVPCMVSQYIPHSLSHIFTCTVVFLFTVQVLLS